MNKLNQLKYAVDQLIGQGNLDVVDSVFLAGHQRARGWCCFPCAH